MGCRAAAALDVKSAAAKPAAAKDFILMIVRLSICYVDGGQDVVVLFECVFARSCLDCQKKTRGFEAAKTR